MTIVEFRHPVPAPILGPGSCWLGGFETVRRGLESIVPVDIIGRCRLVTTDIGRYRSMTDPTVASVSCVLFDSIAGSGMGLDIRRPAGPFGWTVGRGGRGGYG